MKPIALLAATLGSRLTGWRWPAARVGHAPAVQGFLRLAALLSLMALWLPLRATDYSAQARWGVAGWMLAMAVLTALLAQLSRRVPLTSCLVAALAGAIACLAGIGQASGLGVYAGSMQVLAVVVLAAGVLLHPVYAWLMALLGWTAVALLAVYGPGAVLLNEHGTHANRGLVHAFSISVALFIVHLLHAILEAQERRLAGMLRIAAQLHWETDREQRITLLGGFEALGFSAGRHWVGRHWRDLPELALDPASAATLAARLDAMQPFEELPARLRQDDGSIREVTLSGAPRHDAWRRFHGFWGVVRDVTPQMRAQREVAASEVRYRSLFEHCPLPLVLHRDGRVVDANPAALALFDAGSAAALRGDDLFALFLDDDGAAQRGRTQALAQQATPGGDAAAPVAYRRRRADGSLCHLQATGTRMDLPDGAALLTFFIDESERHAAEQRLARSQRLLSHLIDACPDTISLSETDTGRYVLANRSFTRAMGYNLAEIVGRSDLELGLWACPEDRERLVEQINQKGRVEHFRSLARRGDGSVFPLEMSAASFVEDGRSYLAVVCRDTTDIDRTRLEHETILRRASIGIAYTRGQRYSHANAQFESMFGWAGDELTGQPAAVIWPSDEAYMEAGLAFAAELDAGRSVEAEQLLRRRDGSLIWCRLRVQRMDGRDASLGTIWIAEDVTERRRVEQALAAARDAAESANRAKSVFLATMSHEIRTPLNGLMGLARLAQQIDLAPARQQEYLRQIVDSAQGLTDVLSDVLDLSKIEAGKLIIERRPFDLPAMLQQVQRAYQPLAEARGLTLQMQIAPGLPGWVQGDLVRVRQVLTNFVANAIKFTAQGGVQVHASLSGERITLAVQDSGPGLDEATQARLFQPFTQADESTTRRFGGTGLGLSICRELTVLMGGRIGVHSSPGLGSRFWVELPLPPVRAPASEAPAPLPQRPLQGRRVLVAEDHPVNMLIAVAMLEQWGAEVVQAGHGREALERVDEARQSGRRFDAVLMDVQMPEMGGHEATRLLRQRYSAGELPVLGLTAAALVEEREAGLAAGMNDFLTKPIEPDRLRAALLRCCAAPVTA